ncbi:MAG: mercury methylation corrinoid protein HgcA [Desulfobacterales bacterium]|nr:mercury methylation corrinoid protein HgcA [Desulfobacterales bacterium]
MSLPRLAQPFVVGSMDTAAGKIPKVSSRLLPRDFWGTFKARWGVGRMNYCVDPGVYALGRPSKESPVFVTANYKMSFDSLRAGLGDRSAWILVLDTKGINVWCAAGKGTFGTTELVSRIQSGGLDRLVSHRDIILPQLAGPGIAAHQVKKLSGYKVIYGPIRAEDLPAFLENGFKAGPEMRQKTFSTWERLVLIPIELVAALKAAAFIVPVLFFAGGFGDGRWLWANSMNDGIFAGLAILAGIAAGAIATPIGLPWLPGRAFSLKGLWPGLAAALALVLFRRYHPVAGNGPLETFSWFFLIPALSSYLAMNFTGASTYTSLSGVKKEMRWAVPFQIGAGVLGLGLWIGARFVN